MALLRSCTLRRTCGAALANSGNAAAAVVSRRPAAMVTITSRAVPLPLFCHAAAPAVSATALQPLCSQRRSFGTTDGPFKHIRPKFFKGKGLPRKKHYGQKLFAADRRKLLEEAQDLLREAGIERPRPFWEVYAKRSVESMHLLEPLEIAMVLRAFDVHDAKIKSKFDVFFTSLQYVRAARNIPGLAVVTFMDVLPRRLKIPEEQLQGLLQHLGRRAADCLWELTAPQAVRLLAAVSAAGVKDAALSARIARKVFFQLGSPEALNSADIAMAAGALASQGHRDLELFRSMASTVSEDGSAQVSPSAAGQLLESFEKLGIDEVPEALQRAAVRAE
eukprot:TRINITY_DN47314_c2_g2_i2.p1 TRINITY_DN47314_c2_g2~~TRINITY_DN47314_c2_g2_i2.p1  ORF type:complete len:349 (-),score=90.51 TRINITY_DN47314_c2_g2_i2:65-1066(-)